MTIIDRILESLRTATRPLTVAEVTATIFPDRPAKSAGDLVRIGLIELRDAGLARSKPAVRRGVARRGRPTLAWEVASPEASTAGAACEPVPPAARVVNAGGALAPDRACVRIGVPAQTGLLPSESWLDFHAPLHPDTSPSAIAEIQRRDVADYVAVNPDATADEISAAVVLPKWNVERALAVIRGEPLRARVVEVKHDPAKERRKGYARRMRRKETAA